jgi:hypothetical protein
VLLQLTNISLTSQSLAATLSCSSIIKFVWFVVQNRS